MTDDPTPLPNLGSLRQTIDALDRTLQDLISERGDLSLAVGDVKKALNLPIVQTAREAQLLRRLIARHRGPLPLQAVLRIWRELIGASIQLQQEMAVAITADPSGPHLWDDARNYFGSVMPMYEAGGALAAIGQLRDGEVSFAVLPWPELESENPWWTYLMEAGNATLRILVRLPFDEGLDVETQDGHPQSLIIGAFPFESSGRDHVFVALRLDPEISRSRIVDILQAGGIGLLGLYSTAGQGSGDRSGVYLLHLDRYVDAGMTEWQEVVAAFGAQYRSSHFIGGYACLSEGAPSSPRGQAR